MLKIGTEAEDDLEWDHDQMLRDMLSRLHDKNAFAPVKDPHTLQGTLRDYQRRGVAWLQYLENLGLNPCLADDMGLGKTLEVIACLLKEREEAGTVPPTLVIAPTSVLGNWRKEIERFAPQLRALVHQGSTRLKDKQAFVETCQAHDVILTSFALARLDEKLLQGMKWHRVVVDEAQNIKNPQAAQTRAILKLAAPHRLALTGTPVENRLLDLWSIFNFLNPGYLGKEAQFRKTFELPIYKGNDRARSATLKKLVEPFILRRVKTDKRIIDDLPDKIEQKMYCTLTPEQASLYEAVVKDVTEHLNDAEGIQRKGLILSTLLKLKQICNHPAQFLQDGSAFTTERSHKLQRLGEMIEEVIDSGESALIFTQFTEIGGALQRYLEHTRHYNTYYLHGGTKAARRDQMVTEFQDPETEPSLFILSLRAGGVGLNLTKANHVFHFDRWWNPSVEDQATDRAFRIGQRKNVFVHKFVAMGTMEERIDAMIEDKKGLSSLIMGNDESWLTELDNDTFKELIALRRSAVLE
jgi:SNF2 family DNA or RNA helicase